jgi:DNA helicase-2/ATP-dependent DNA helicase PcrA
MPVIIDDNNSATLVDVHGAAKTNTKVNTLYTPKFFHKSILTGKGGQSRGLLNEKWDPKMRANGYTLTPNPDMELSTQYNKDIKLYNIPCYLISAGIWANYIRNMKRPALTDMVKIAEKGTEEIYIIAPIHALQIQEQQVVNAPGASATHAEKALAPLINVFIFAIKDMNDENHVNCGGLQMMQGASFTNNKKNAFYQDIVPNLVTCLLDIYNKLTAAGYNVYKQTLDDFLQNYSLYTELCKASEKWLTQADYFINDVLISNIMAVCKGNFDPNDHFSVWTSPKDSVMEMLSRLEKYSIPLEQYKAMYDHMSANLPADIVATISKANLNLRLSNTLQHMDQNRAQNTFVPCTTHVKSKIPFSLEQTAAIESVSPFTLVQSGAGTGKSTVIRGRIDHMIANGVDPHDITVLSFTNAAADHIKDLQPNVHSMTIAAMLHTIYSHNYPTHQLSSLSTILNSLDIYFSPKSRTISAAQRTFVDKFKRILERLRDNNEYTKANNFVEDYIDETIDVLNVIQQTSLELESIICYQKMDTLVEPDETKTKHLIIDEVQDNSIAEFIYSIKYTDKHQCSMYIVGDCSQTLYEFRASNPKALNVLEASGVFETYKLQTNYRSNQEILDFANVLLGNIEANQYANIQLHANSLAPVTKKSFQKAVTLHYERMQNKSAVSIDNLISHSIAVDTKAWIDDKLQKGEQVAFLAPKRYTLTKIEDYLRRIYGIPRPTSPGMPDDIVSLVPAHPHDNAVFSKFIARYWDNIQYVPPANILTTIRRELASKFDYLMPYKSQAALQKARDDIFGRPGQNMGIYGEFEAMYKNRVATWQNQVSMSVLTTAQMLEEVKKIMITFEIQRNAVMKSVISQKNADNKNSQAVENAKFILSTIHSAKGLEFDNVVVFYESESAASVEEATKRMYYVAFTRAKKAEFIFAYDTMAYPKICGDYEKIIDDLDKQAAAAIANGTALPDDDDDDDTVVIQTASNTPMAVPGLVKINAGDSDDEPADSMDDEDEDE